MSKTYRNIQLWDRWLSQYPGREVLNTEQLFLPSLLSQYYGTNALLIGVPRQHVLLKDSVIVKHTVLSPILNDTTVRGIESGLHELPILSGSVDLVMLPHTLECTDNPQHLLSEACRIVKPEGHILIFGFNPLSLGGLKKWWRPHKIMPWTHFFLSSARVRKWLALADFELIKKSTLLFRPLVKNEALFQQLKWMEWVGMKSGLPVGGVYMLLAKAKTLPLTPIKLRWKQPFTSVSLPTVGIPK